jgi:hypothetical protein
MMVSLLVSAAPYPFVDEFDAVNPDWTLTGLWSVSGGVLNRVLHHAFDHPLPPRMKNCRRELDEDMQHDH